MVAHEGLMGWAVPTNRIVARPSRPWPVILALVIALLAGIARPAAAADSKVTPDQLRAIATRVDAEYDSLFELYQDFHRHPELSLHEERTARNVAKAFADAGYDVTTGVGGHGVVAIMKNGPGPVLMLRCDMDALPVKEKTGLPYASTVEVDDGAGRILPVMHACGHDVHMVTVIGAGRVMARLRDQWAGTLVLIGQPSEESVSGARKMLGDGLFTRFPKPDYALSLHVDAHMAAGCVGYTEGYAMANADGVNITVRGRGGHGAAPHEAVDPVVLAARIVLGLQTIVSRETKPTDPAVITVGSIHGGERSNIIPDEVKLSLTVRSYSKDVRKHLHEAIERMARGSAASAAAPEPIVTFREGTPAMYNDPPLIARCVPVFEQALGKDRVGKREPVVGAEDFGRYGKAGVSAFMFRLGTVSPERLAASKGPDGQPLPSSHSPQFAPVPEPTIKTGVITMSAAALNLLAK